MAVSFYFILAGSSLVFFAAQLSSFIIFPFLPFMVSSFFPNLDRSELGKTAGYLGSAFFFGYIPGCLFFAILADKLGRRFVMIFTMFGVAACQLVFGFSLNFVMAITARVASGFFGGGIATARTYTSEISNENNKAFAFAIVGSMSAMGRITGSIIGGFLAQPGSKYGLFKLPFFCQFQFLLPCLVGTAIALVAGIYGIFFLKETYTPKSGSVSNTYKMQILRNGVNGNGKNKNKSKVSCSDTSRYYFHKFARKIWNILTPLMEAKVIVTLLLFGLGPLAFISAVELVPLLFVNDYLHGGYDMDDTEIGVLMLLSTLAIILTQIILYSLISRCIGYRWTFRLTAILFASFTIVIPFSTQLTGPVPATSGSLNFSDYCQNDNSSITMSVNANSVWRIPLTIWAILTVLYSFQTLLRVMYSTGTIVMFGSATTAKSRSFVNGVGQAIYGMSAIIAPLASAPILAWSENNSMRWPLNYHFVFELVALFLLTMTVFSFLVPQSIEKDKNAPKDIVEDEDKSKEKEDILGSFKIDSEDESDDDFYN